MKTLKRISIVTLCMIFVIASLVCPAAAEETEPTPKKFIKWMTFTVPYEALVKAKDIDIQSHDDTLKINWVDLLAYLGAKYGGNWKKFCEKDMTALVKKLKSGQSMTELTKELKYYNFFHETYDAVLSNFIGDYQIEVRTETAEKGWRTNMV